MKKQVKLTTLLLLILVIIMGVMLVGCDKFDADTNTPQQLIQDKYGNKEYTISFSTESLDKPIKDMTYSANKIPVLPTPQKMGYIFEGWFLDPDFVTPYTDGALLLAMRDIKLYPKWTKENFLHNGIYDINFDAKIIDGTVKKGLTTDQYGGYKDFTKALVKENCHIEKNDDELILQLQYDCGTTTPFQAVGEVYTVRMNDKMGTSIYIKNRINSLADPIKTIFIRINNWDLADTLYLDIEWTNFENENLTEQNRYSTTTSYEVAIDLTNIIGFSKPFVDPELPLEKGYYLAKSHFRQENNTESMAKTFDPVYSYLYSDGNKNYKLIKQVAPYPGLVALKHPLYNPITDNYYDMDMCFTAVATAFDVESRVYEGEVKSDYYPETYNAGYYRPTSIEFHADTGKVYTVIELDKDLSKEYIALTAVSGYMEREAGMGYIRQICSIDYKNLIKLAEVDYEPLEGDSYEYQREFGFYPGNYADMDLKNTTRDSIEKFGISIEMPNFYYSASSMNAPIKERTIYSSKVTVVPNKKTNAKPIKNSRGEMAEFIVHSNIYGYDVKNGEKLFLDRMNPQSIAGKTVNNQLRDVVEVRTGKSCEKGDKIDLSKLFKDKVNNEIGFSLVKVNAYDIKNGTIDFGSKLTLNSKQITFSKDIAIEFLYEIDGTQHKTIVELVNTEKPTIEVQDSYSWSLGKNGHYQKTAVTKVGKTVKFPKINYSWGDIKGKSIDNFYDRTDGEESINPSKTILFGDNGGFYTTYIPLSHRVEFEIPEQNVILMYELDNVYGEKQFVYFDYYSDNRDAYTIKDSEGNTIVSNDLKFNEHGRVPVSYTYTAGSYFDVFDETCIKQYIHEEGPYVDNYDLLYYDIYSNDGEQLQIEPKTNSEIVTTINTFLKDKAFGCVRFCYGRYSDRLYVDYLYKITFDGLSSYQLLDYNTYFTNTEYTFGIINLVGSNMQNLGHVSASLKRFVDGRPVMNQVVGEGPYKFYRDEKQYKATFYIPGTYQFTYSFSIPTSVMGDPYYRYLYIEFSQMIEVKNHLGDINITYHTDDLHPFNDGSKDMTITYNLGEGFNLMNFSQGFDTKNYPNQDRTVDVLRQWGTTFSARSDSYSINKYFNSKDYITEFNDDSIDLYAIWDIRFRIECDIPNQIPNPSYVTAKFDSFRGDYEIYFPDVKKSSVPEGYEFAGWTGGFLGDGIYEKSSIHIPYRDDYYKEEYKEYFKISAVYLPLHQVSFEVDSNIAYYIEPIRVREGKTIDNAPKLVMKNSSYRFVGFCLANDQSEKIVNLSKYVVEGPVIFKAVFAKK